MMNLISSCFHFAFLSEYIFWGLPRGSSVKNTLENAGDTGSIPGLGRFPGERNGNPLQYSFLGNPTDIGA